MRYVGARESPTPHAHTPTQSETDLTNQSGVGLGFRKDLQAGSYYYLTDQKLTIKSL